MVEVACETARDAFSGVQVGAHARGGVSSDGRGVAVDSAPLVLDVSQSYALCGLQSRLVDEQAYVDVCVFSLRSSLPFLHLNAELRSVCSVSLAFVYCIFFSKEHL